MSRDGIQLLLATLLGEREVVSFRPALARVLGPIPALFLCQACYWQGVKGADEWWYKLRNADRDTSGNMLPPSNGGRQSWEWELGLSRSEQEGARRVLRRHELLEEALRGVPAQLHYRVNLDRLAEFLLAIQQMAEFAQLDGRNQPASGQNSPSKLGRIAPTNTETTTSITAAAHASVRGTAGAAAPIDQDQNQKRKHPNRTRHGIECWYPAEDLEAAAIEAAHNPAAIKAAVAIIKSRLNGAGKKTSPVPTFVLAELAKIEAEQQRLEQERQAAAGLERRAAASAVKSASAQAYFESLDETSRTNLLEQFARHLADNNSSVLQFYRRNGLESKSVQIEFVKFISISISPSQTEEVIA